MPLTSYLGEIAALLTSICFAIGPTFNTLAGQRVSNTTVNRVRLSLTLVLLIIPHWLLEGVPFPVNGRPENWLFMGLSGLLGLVIGDSLLFAAFVTIGTRLTMLISCLMPVFSSLMAWVVLNESLTELQVVGIVVTISGVGWVVFDPNNESAGVRDRKAFVRGALLALTAAFFHAAGTIAAKRGMGDGFPTLSAHMIRTGTSLVLILLPLLLPHRAKQTIQELRGRPEALKYLFWGAIFGPLLGMWLSLYSIQNANVGIATSLSSLSPIWLLPVGRFFFHEKIGGRAVLGSLVAVIGAAIIFIY